MTHCKDCKYWYQSDSHLELGECRLKSPVWDVTTDKGKNPHYSAAWPYTYNIDWCGKFERKIRPLTEKESREALGMD